MTRRRILPPPAAAALGVMVMALPGCGNAVTTTITGQTALSKGADGAPVAYLDSCEGGVTEVFLSGNRDGKKDDETNPSLGELSASTPQSGHVVVPLTKVGPPWKATTSVTLPTKGNVPFIVNGAQRSKDTELTQVSATLDQIGRLAPGQVITDSGRVMAEAAFHAQACTPKGG